MTSNPLHDLTRGSVPAHLRRQATPFALGLVAIFSFEAVDLFFISRLGDAPLAAISFCFPIIWLIHGLGIGLAAATASCVSRAVGRGDQRLARRLTTDSVILSALLAVCLTAIGLLTIEPLFKRLGATPELLPLIGEYMRTWYWVAPIDLVLWCATASIRARGNALLESKIIMGAALLNLILDPIFIFGLFGFPRLEIQGAALATLVSTGLTLTFTLVYLSTGPRVFARLSVPLSIIMNSWRTVLHIGVPAMATNAVIPASSAIVVAMIAAFGTDAVAGYGVAMRVEPMFLIPFYALSAVSSPFFGQNFGAGKPERLISAQRAVARFCLGFGVALTAVLWLLARPIATLFSPNPDIVQVAVHYLYIVPISYGAYGVVMSTNASFNGMGYPLPGVVISVSRVLALFLPLALLGRWLLGLPGLFLASTLSNLLLALVGFLWLRRMILARCRRVIPDTLDPSPDL